VVEDDAGWIELLKLWFPAAGYTAVEYAVTGAQALEAAVQRKPDCVLLDFGLPDQNGCEVCSKLRAIPALTRVPVVMFTAHGREKVLGLENGADYFVGKTDSSRELMATLGALFKRAKQEPGVLAHGEDFFVMDFLEPARHPVWKALLRDGHADHEFAGEVGRRLAAIHAGTTGAEMARAFATDEIFHAIRLEPYLLATAKRHPDLAASLQALAERTAATRECLVHGDVSPKNILAGPSGPVFLDAECAWYGDPAFDLAFCLNHLLLKCLWVAPARRGFLRCFDALAQGYLERVSMKDVEARAASLLPALLLARVDGKSPVEYLTEAGRKETVRRTARALIRQSPQELQQVREAWQESLT